MGVNGRKKYQPVIAYYKSMEGDNDMGEYRYWDNEIIVYYNNCRTVSNLIRTIVHEWQHQLQPMTKYEKIHNEVGYDDHPFEIEAEAVLMKRIKEMRDGKPKYAASDRLQEIRSALKLIKSYESGASLGELIGQ